MKILDDVTAIGQLESIKTVLRVLRLTTGLRVALVARMTESEWVTCAILDEAGLGVAPGDTLELANTY